MTQATISTAREFIVDALRKKTGVNKDRIGIHALFRAVEKVYPEITKRVFEDALSAMVIARSVEIVGSKRDSEGTYVRFYVTKTPPEAPPVQETTIPGNDDPPEPPQEPVQDTSDKGPDETPEQETVSATPPDDPGKEAPAEVADDKPNPPMVLKDLLPKVTKSQREKMENLTQQVKALTEENAKLREHRAKQGDLIESALVVLEKVPGASGTGLLEAARLVTTQAISKPKKIDGQDIYYYYRMFSLEKRCNEERENALKTKGITV